MAIGILLVGGMGTRLKPLTNQTPKPMLPVAGLPVTERQLLAAKKAGISTVILATPGTFYGPLGASHIRVAMTATDLQIGDAAARIRQALK